MKILNKSFGQSIVNTNDGYDQIVTITPYYFIVFIGNIFFIRLWEKLFKSFLKYSIVFF